MRKTATIVFLLISVFVRSQDLVYTQTFGSPMYVNPAFTGNLAKTSFYFNARQQWPKLDGSYIASSFAANHMLQKISSGVGIIVLQEQQGSSKVASTNVSGIYSYILHLNKDWSVSPALQMSYINTRFDQSSFIFGDQLNEDFSIAESSSESYNFSNKSSFDVSSGAIAYNENVWVGIAAHHLTEPTNFINNGTSLKRKFSIHGGYSVEMKSMSFKSPILISPSVNINYQQPFTRLGLNLVTTVYNISIGTGLANISSSQADQNILNSFVLLGYSDEHFKVGYSYDFTVSRGVGLGGAHELSIGVLLNYDNNSSPNPLKHKKIRKVSCPKF